MCSYWELDANNALLRRIRVMWMDGYLIQFSATHNIALSVLRWLSNYASAGVAIMTV